MALPRTVRLLMRRDVARGLFEIYTDDVRLPGTKVTDAFIMSVLSDPRRTIENLIRDYVSDLVSTYGVPGYAIDYSYLGGYMSMFGFSQPSFAERIRETQVLGTQIIGSFLNTAETAMLMNPVPPSKPAEPLFEVNMMEALVGWKAFRVDGAGLLHSPSYDATWLPDVAHEAVCRHNIYDYGVLGAKEGEGVCHDSPTQNHSCGIYATDRIDGAISYAGANRGRIMAQVHGWGRYVRGDSGWRAQYAYPKSFHLTSMQVELVEPLKAYHAEIFIEQPLRIYDPREDGYEIEGGMNGHGQDATGRDRRTFEGAGAEED